MDASSLEDTPPGRREDVLMTFQELAAIVGATSKPHRAELTHVSNLSAAQPDSIVFASDSKTLAEALRSMAGAVLAPLRLSPSENLSVPRILYVTDPRYAFAQAAAHFTPPRSAEIHHSAMISPNIHLGQGTTIASYAVLGEGVRIGIQCTIGSHVTIHAGTTVGDRVMIQSGAVLGCTGFGYARNPETGAYLLFPQQGTLFIEDDVEIGANTTIDRGALGETRIGRGTKIDNLVHIGHNCVIGKDVLIAAQTGISGSSIVEDGAILGGQVGIGEHATVGSGVILGGGAGVLSGKKMHGSGQVFWGRPARPLKEYLRDLARLRGGSRNVK